MSHDYFLRALLAAALLAFSACGSRPSANQAAERKVVVRTDTTASKSLPTASESKRESTNTEAPDAKPSIVPKAESLPDVVKKTFPGAASVRSKSDPFPHRVIRDSDERVLGYEAFSDSAGVTAKGYAGMVPVQVFFDAKGRPLRIFVLDNCETPAYLDIVVGAGLLDKLLVFDPAKPESVDAVTLATTSSRAIIAGVTGLAARVSAELAAKSSHGSH